MEAFPFYYIYKMIRTGFFLLFSLIGLSLYSQSDSLYKGSPQPLRYALGFGTNFNLDDFYFDFNYGLQDTEYQWGAALSFDMRPYFKKVQIVDKPNHVSQYFEKKFFLALEGEKRFLELHVGSKTLRALLAAKVGWLFGNYRGLKQAPQSYFGFSPMAGFSFDLGKSGYFKFGYCFLDNKNINIPNNRIFFGITFLLGEI